MDGTNGVFKRQNNNAVVPSFKAERIKTGSANLMVLEVFHDARLGL